MKKLLITLLLISPFSFADWDDVYYCQMTNSLGITVEGKRTNYTLQKFTFKLDKTKNAMVFGKDGWFKGFARLELKEGSSFPNIEIWRAGSEYTASYFVEGKFLFSSLAMTSTSMSADCDKF